MKDSEMTSAVNDQVDKDLPDVSDVSVVSVDCKPKPKGTPRGSRNEKIYQEGLIPAEHLKVYKGFKEALEAEGSGELILQRIVEKIGMSRTSILKIIPFLEKYGYIKYESRPREHRIFVEILK